MCCIEATDGEYTVKILYSGDKVFHKDHFMIIERLGGDKEWRQDGLLHRLEGPAVEWSDGGKSWYFEGNHIDCKTQEEFEKLLKIKAFW